MVTNKMEYTSRGGVTSYRECISPREISKTIADMDMGPWISSIIEDALHSADLGDNDFMGKKGDTVSISDIVEAMAYYAAVTGYSTAWESNSSSVFENFGRRPGVYETLTRKLENVSTQNGNKKLTGVKKCIRVRVSDKAKTMSGKPSPVGVFVDGADDIAEIYYVTENAEFINSLHKLGECSQENPRFYVHMIFRYYMNDFHKKMADQGQVLRFPSILKIMDIKNPYVCTLSIPSEFRMFIKSARGDKVSTVTLPVPSKSKADEVIYGYDFESAVPWVPVMRARIFEVFNVLCSTESAEVLRQIYPACLLKGNEWNSVVVDALAKSIEMEHLVQTLDGLRGTSPDAKIFFEKVLVVDARVANVYTRYNQHLFEAEGEQLPERVGFFAQESVRGIFYKIATSMSSFCNDMYTSLNIKFATVDLFVEYCTTKNFMTYKKRGDECWRDFVINMQKICCVLNAWNRRLEVDRFLRENGTTDGILRSAIEKFDG